MKSTARKQSGFTLVEIAIVLVIIGILLAGVLKGQSMINNSRIKGLVNNLNAVSAAYNGYIDRYQRTPGTETRAAVNARGWATTQTGATPLSMPVATTFATTTGQTAFWQVLKAGGFFAGNQTDTTNPPSANGGLIGVAITPYTGTPGISACLSSVTDLQAEGIDTIVDGPLPATNIGSNTGSLQGASGPATTAPLAPSGGAAPAVAYNETSANLWTLCKPL